VEVVRQIEPLVEPRVGNLVLALAPQVDDEFGLGFETLPCNSSLNRSIRRRLATKRHASTSAIAIIWTCEVSAA
jgi:hypothetical protein